MSLFNLSVIMPATSFALVLLGGGLYEFSVVDPSGMAVERLTHQRMSKKLCPRMPYKTSSRRKHARNTPEGSAQSTYET